MYEKEISGKTFLVPEMDDILKAKILGEERVIDDWPYGRQKRCVMRFYVETSKRGQRFCKQSTFNGRTNKPKTATYADRVTLVEIDGMIGRVEYSIGYQLVKVRLENSKYIEATFFEADALIVANHFFKD